MAGIFSGCVAILSFGPFPRIPYPHTNTSPESRQVNLGDLTSSSKMALNFEGKISDGPENDRGAFFPIISTDLKKA
jgi:hypothetical protein